MLSVLFVDNEAAALDALRRQLHSQRNEWEMHFVATPSAALAVAAEHVPDVVVTDLRLPEMSGTQLLQEIEKRCPHAVRMVMSGMVNQRAFVESIGIAHQFLPKPFDLDALKHAIVRACELRRWIARPEVADAVTQLGRLPRLPQVHHQLSEAVQRDASLAEIGRIIGADPALTARLLQVANSAFFSPRHPITSVELAASFLGIEMLRPIVLFEGVSCHAEGDPVVQARMQRIWRHSLRIGSTARSLAQHEHLTREEIASAFSLGVMHDIGAILLAKHHEPFETCDPDRTADELERARHGLAHTEAGACLVLSWGLPDDVVEVVAFHHDPRRFGKASRPTPGFFVAAADALGDEGSEGEDDAAVARLREALAVRGLSDRFEAWRRIAGLAEQMAGAERP